MKSLIGTKIGMTQIFSETGNAIPVTVVLAGPCLVTGIRTKEKNGYNAVQLGYRDIAEKKLSKPAEGHFKKLGIAPKKVLCEILTSEIANYQIGQELKADVFKVGDYVDVSGVSKGKGFAGVMKRHNFSGAQQTHGQSDRQRAPGSSGAQGKQRVAKGTKKPGHLGQESVTIQRLQIVGVDPEKNIILIKGALPGANKSIVMIDNTVKRLPVVQHVDPKAKKKAAPAKGRK